MPSIGEQAPSFDLPDTEGATWPLDGAGAPATVVVFTCNHCPYALAWHDRIADAARDYADRGVRFLAINANDADRYPRDSLEAMRQRVGQELADALPARRDPGGRARLRRQDDAGRVRDRCLGHVFATAARRTPTTTTRASAPRGCATRSTRCWTARARPGRDQAGRLLDQVEAVAG